MQSTRDTRRPHDRKKVPTEIGNDGRKNCARSYVEKRFTTIAITTFQQYYCFVYGSYTTSLWQVKLLHTTVGTVSISFKFMVIRQKPLYTGGKETKRLDPKNPKLKKLEKEKREREGGKEEIIKHTVHI